MYRRPKFLEVLLEIRQEMARQADYDVDLFSEMVRTGSFSAGTSSFKLSEPEAAAGTARPRRRKPGSDNGKIH